MLSLSAARSPLELASPRRRFAASSSCSLKVCESAGKFRRNALAVRGTMSVEDVNSGELDVVGWKVHHAATKEMLGTVEELIPIRLKDDTICQQLLSVSHLSSSATVPRRYLIPLVDAIVVLVDEQSRSLSVSPPDGLLELGRRQEKLERLRVALSAYFFHDSEHDASRRNDMEGHMPTRSQLIADGRPHLVDEIMEAGGFLSVAYALNLRACRRPDGFWENLEVLDDAVERFIDDCWREIEIEGEVYFRNVVTDETHKEIPSVRSAVAVMPRQKTVIEARRWDLHHAIRMHGGYSVVARELGRQHNISIYSFADFVNDIKGFMEEHGLNYFPLKRELEAWKREDLLHSMRKFGGFRAVSKKAGIPIRPSPVRQLRRQNKAHSSNDL